MDDFGFLPQPFPPFPPHHENKPGEPLSAWALLARGKTLGKSMNVQFTAGTSVGTAQSGTVDILKIQDEDRNAHQLCLTLSPPEIYNPGPPIPEDIQTLSGSQDNINYPTVFPPGSVGGVVQAVPLTDLGLASPVAIVEWGIGGITDRVEADFRNGLCLNLTASWLRVRAFMDNPGPLPYVSTAIYRLAANIGPGYPKTSNAQRTIVANMTGVVPINTESSVYTIPRYAHSVHLCGANEAHDVFTGTIRFYRNASGPTNPTGIVAEYLFSANNNIPVPIPAGAYYFTVVPGIDNTVGLQAVFQLAV